MNLKLGSSVRCFGHPRQLYQGLQHVLCLGTSILASASFGEAAVAAAAESSVLFGDAQALRPAQVVIEVTSCSEVDVLWADDDIDEAVAYMRTV